MKEFIGHVVEVRPLGLHVLDQFQAVIVERQLDVSVHHRTLSELQFNLGPDNGRNGFALSYDGIAYTQQEISQLAEKICALLDLEMTGAHMP